VLVLDAVRLRVRLPIRLLSSTSADAAAAAASSTTAASSTGSNGGTSGFASTTDASGTHTVSFKLDPLTAIALELTLNFSPNFE